tara:strand:- start:59 stop:238 length:180 start_codon:yes stop_codon:yes gene_type:complete
MPKKKYNKTRVKREMARVVDGLTNMLFDKMQNPDSVVPISGKVLMEMNSKVRTAFKRIK